MMTRMGMEPLTYPHIFLVFQQQEFLIYVLFVCVDWCHTSLWRTLPMLLV